MNGDRWPWWGLGILVASLGPVWGEEMSREAIRYVRPAGGAFATECKFLLTRHSPGWTLSSQTERGVVRLTVEAHYDPGDRLTAGKAVLITGERVQTATVEVKDGRATVRRHGAEPASFDVPKGTIVTSAPDWSDVLLLCRRYDRRLRGRQEYPALWIHPTQAAQRLTFSIEWQGTDRIEHQGQKVELDRYLIRIRNNSGYAAWADRNGRLVRLLPLPAKELGSGLILEGYEKAAAGLRFLPQAGGGVER